MSKNSYKEQYAWFIQLCQNEFQFIIDDYNFSNVLTDMNGYEIDIIYRRDEDTDTNIKRVGVGIHWEVPMVIPNISFTLSEGSIKKPKVKKYSIFKLIQERCPELSPIRIIMGNNEVRSVAEKGILTQEEVILIIRNYVKIIKMYGTNILNGDFTDLEN